MRMSKKSNAFLGENLIFKLASDSRDVVDKKARERKRNLLYLIDQFLRDEGYLETAESLETEAQMSAQFCVCDNVDLATVLQEYESYFFLRFQKHPKICKLLQPEKNGPSKLEKKPKKAMSQPPRKSCSEEAASDMSDLISVQSLTGSGGKEEPEAFKEALHLSPELLQLSDTISREIVRGEVGVGVRWEDVVGLQKAKQALRETLLLPLQFPTLFQGILAPWRSVLLYGPPGTGKTMVAKALLSSDPNLTFFNITATSVVSKWRGESEKLIRVLFESARQQAPSVIFMDEFEALACRSPDDHEGSRRLRAELLMQMDGLASSEKVFLLAVTNSPWTLQGSLLRRFEKRILVDLPGLEDRRLIVQRLLPKSQHPHLHFSVDCAKIAQLTKGYSGSDLKTVCREASMKVLREALANTDGHVLKAGRMGKLEVRTEEVEEAVFKTKPTAGCLQNKYHEWQKNFGSG